MSDRVDRRGFVKVTAGLGAAMFLPAIRMADAQAPAVRRLTTNPQLEFRVPPIDPVRIGYVGVGGMGSAHVRNLLRIEGVQVRAVCDIVPEKVARVRQWVIDAGQPPPEGYTRGPQDFRRLCERDDIDLRVQRDTLGMARPHLGGRDGIRQARGD